VIQYKFWNSDAATPNGGWESPGDGGNNRAANLPSSSGATLVLPTAFFSDAGVPVTYTVGFEVNMAQQINLGVFNTNSDIVYARGNFNGFGLTFALTNDPTIKTTNRFGLVSSNVYVGAMDIVTSPNASQGFKFYNSDAAPAAGWESPGLSHANPGDSGNRFFFNTGNQTLPIVDFSDSPFAPIVTNMVTFQVDMSALAGGLFQPSDPIDVRGNFNGWSGGVNPLTNNPSAANTNIYSAVVAITDGVGATEQYKFTYTGGLGTQWENPGPPTIGGNRFFVQPNLTATNLPVVLFSDVLPNEVLPEDTEVTFSVDMTGAHETGGTPFDPSTGQVFVNGDWLGWPTWDVPHLTPYQLTNNPVGSSNYSLTLLIQKGNPLPLTYKYGIYDGSNPNALDNEAPSGQNHYRYIRQAPNYSLPTDTFGFQFGEPVAFGNLTAGAAVAGRVPISWLGEPGVRLQSTASLSAGTVWTDLFETDGTNWLNGHISNNGFVSVTNYPTGGGKTFFRLIRPGH